MGGSGVLVRRSKEEKMLPSISEFGIRVYGLRLRKGPAESFKAAVYVYMYAYEQRKPCVRVRWAYESTMHRAHDAPGLY